jgi:VanZ family protein
VAAVPASFLNRNQSLLSLWLPVIVYMAVIFYLSSLPEPVLPADVSDKSAHSFGYAGFAIFVTRAVAGGLPRRVTARTAITVMLMTMVYSLSDELHQTFVPGRVADIYDIQADAIGAAIGTFICWAWGIISSRGRSMASTRDEL